MQSWLYFGILSEFLDAPVDMKPFQKSSESGSIFLSSKALESLVWDRTCSLLELSKRNGSLIVAEWRVAFYEVLLIVRYYTLFIVTHAANNDEQALSLTGPAISVLEKYLMTALCHCCGSIGVEQQVTQKWRVVSTKFPADCGLPILKSMQSKGWCAYDLALFHGAEVEKVSTLWYLANLSPPEASMSHSSCNAEICRPLHIEKPGMSRPTQPMAAIAPLSK